MRIAIPFIIGIITGIYLHLQIPNSISTAVIISAVVVTSFLQVRFTSYSTRWIFGATITIIFITIGILWATHKKAVNQYNYFEQYATDSTLLVVKIDKPLQEKERSYKAVATVKQVVNNAEYKIVSGTVQLYFSKTASLTISYGDWIIIPYKKLRAIEPPKNPHEFDYSQFMAFKQIHHQSFLKENDWYFLKHDSENIFLENIYKLRNYLVDVLKLHLTNQQLFSIASSLLLGARENLDFHLIKAYSSAGAMHVLAVSGLHVGILYIIIERMLFFMNRNRKLVLIKAILIIIITWLYAMLTGFSPSVQRAAIMFTFITIGKQSERGYNIYNVLSASALFQLLLNPFAIMEVGFQLSYLAVAGIVMFQKFFYDLLYVKNKVLDYFWQITCVSISAQLITFPIGLLYFYQFPTYFFVSNLFVIPISFVIMILGTILLALHQIPGCAWVIGKFLSGLIWLMNKSVFVTEQLPYSLIQGLSISIFESWIIYFIILSFFAFIHTKNPKIIITQLFLITMLVGYNTVENIFQYAQKRFVVYTTPRTYAYDFIKGKKNLLIAEDSLYNNYSQMQFYIMHNWWNNDIRTHHHTTFNSNAHSLPNSLLFQHKNYFYFCGKRIVILDKKLPVTIPDRPLNVDYIILTKNAKVYLDKIKHYYSFNTIIADGNNAMYRLKQWEKDAETGKIKFSSVTNDGAFVADF